MNTYVTGTAIKQLREARGMTQAELAQQIGVSSKTVSKWETAIEMLRAAMPDAEYEIVPLSPAFITQGGPGCMAIQYVQL